MADNDMNGMDMLREAAKRDLTDEAREAVGRLRGVKPENCGKAGLCWNALIEALGTDSSCLGDGEMSYSHDMRLTRDRLIELIELGGKQDVDVAALRALADDLEITEVVSVDTGYASGYEDACEYAAERIRKAIAGAQEPVTFASLAQQTIFSEAELRDMVSWIETHGGLDEVRDQLAALDDFSEREAAADLVQRLGGIGVVEDYRETLVKIGRMLGEDDGELPVLPEVLIDDLDERLMPPGMRKTDSKGKPVSIGDRVSKKGRASGCEGKVVGYALGADGSPCFVVDASAPDGCAAGTWRTWLFRCRDCRKVEPQALGADGKPIKVGETVYHEIDGYPLVVTGFGNVDRGERLVRTSGDYSLVGCQSLTHERPDTQARIDDDKEKESEGYWGCADNDCEACPSLIGGEKPCEHYGVVSCAVAQGMDIARREQELRARTGGAR